MKGAEKAEGKLGTVWGTVRVNGPKPPKAPMFWGSINTFYAILATLEIHVCFKIDELQQKLIYRSTTIFLKTFTSDIPLPA